jgi:hypothetical protein
MQKCKNGVCSFKNLLLQNQWAKFNRLGTIILGGREFKVIQMKVIALLQGEIIAKE